MEGKAMKISFDETSSAESFDSQDLKTRTIESSKTKKTRHYRVVVNGLEAAFLSLDRWPEPEINQIVIYELYVAPAMRGRGIGSAVLAEVELLAIKEGFHKVHLRPVPLDRETSEDELINWYLHRGYSWDPAIADEMEKVLSKDKQ
jgi:GNAT superfamily N-acetyltransferase